MKKAIVAILAFLYVSIASGVVVNIHYCMGTLASVEYGFQDSAPCSKCGMKEKKGCCHTEFKVVKLQDAHLLQKSSIEFGQFEAVAPGIEIVNVPFLKEQPYIAAQYHSPPDPRINSVYLHNCVFRI